jgi:hypothetical protein
VALGYTDPPSPNDEVVPHLDGVTVSLDLLDYDLQVLYLFFLRSLVEFWVH